MEIRWSNFGLLLLTIYCMTSERIVAQDTTISVNKGLRLAKEKKYEEAINIFEQCLKSSPKNPDLYFYQGNAFMDLLQFEKALEQFSKSISHDSSYTDAYINRASCYFQIKNYTLAYQDYTKVLKLDANNSDANYLRGNCSYKLGNFEAALVDYESALQKDVNAHATEYALGNVYFTLEKFEKALSHYDRAIELNNRFSNYYFNRAITEYNLGFPEDACADFNNAKELGDSEAESYIKEFCH